MKIVLSTLSLAFISTLAVCGETPSLIPLPAQMTMKDGHFTLNAKTRIATDSDGRETGNYLAEQLRRSTGFQLTTQSPANSGDNVISLQTDTTLTNLGSEGYDLDVSPTTVTIRAPDSAGLFYGVQSLLQLLPPAVYSSNVVRHTTWEMPCVQIEDQPRFKWRGLMLDVSRHFFNKEEIKRLLDEMASQKLNTFHWHLADDQGWRIEIKKYPQLTESAAWRGGVGFGFPADSTTAYDSQGRYGGFYTQADIREIVAYATARHITIVPEIEMPGHSTAVLSVYPELGCTGERFTVPLKGGVMHGIYCAGNDETFAFLQNVLTEVFELFPSHYIHIGGDEVPKDNWKKCPRCQARMKAEGLTSEHELQSWFVRRIEKFINAHDRNLIGWSEIREGGLAESAAVMDWIGGGLEAAREGHNVIMTPTEFCYLDYYQSLDQANEPKAICCYLPLKKVYSFEPVPVGLPIGQQAHILGGQGNIWTEFIPNFRQVEYMAFPRLSAMAEVVWSPASARNWDDFQQRLVIEERRLAEMGVNFRRDASVKLGTWTASQINRQETILKWDVTGKVSAPGQYRVSPEYTQGQHGLSITEIALLENGKAIAQDQHNGFTGASPKNSIYVLNLPSLQPGARYELQARAAGDGGTDSNGTISWVYKPSK